MIKLLPGSSLNIGNGTKLEGKELVIYSAFIDGYNGQRDDARWSAGSSYPVKNPAICEIQDGGSISMEKIGGYVYASNVDCISYSNSDIVSSKEPWNQKQSGLQYVTKDYLEIREKLCVVSQDNKTRRKIIVAQNTFFDPNDYPNPFLPSVSVFDGVSTTSFDGIQGIVFVADNIEKAKLIFNGNISSAKKGIGNSATSYSFSTYKYEEEVSSNYDLILSTVNSKNEIIRNDEINEFLPQSISIRSLTPKVGGKDPLYPEKNIYLTADIVDELKIYDKTIKWSSSDESIATVDSSGKVTGLLPGEVIIYAQCGDKIAEYPTEVLENSEVVALEDAWIVDESGKYTSIAVAGSHALNKVNNSSGVTFSGENYEYNYLTEKSSGSAKFYLKYSPENSSISKVVWKFTGSTKQAMIDYDGKTELVSGSTLNDDGSLSCTLKWKGFTNTDPDGCSLTCTITDISGKITEVKFVILHDSGYCIVEGTLIQIDENVQKSVEKLKIGEELLSFNHLEGKFERKKLFFNYHADEFNLVCGNFLTLDFENKISITIYKDHGFFDMTMNKYVYINENNFASFIGHMFAYVNNSTIESVKLISGSIKEDKKRVYSPVTMENMNVIANGFISITGEVFGWFNFFEYGKNLKYKENDVISKIEQYGLYSKDYFSDYINEYVYDALPIKYLKVSVGKGEISENDIKRVLTKYLSKEKFK